MNDVNLWLAGSAMSRSLCTFRAATIFRFPDLRVIGRVAGSGTVAGGPRGSATSKPAKAANTAGKLTTSAEARGTHDRACLVAFHPYCLA